MEKNTSTYTLILVEDELNARSVIARMIKEHCPQVRIVGETGSIKTAAKIIQLENPQILCLDIKLRDGNAFELLEMLPFVKAKVIFLTAYNHYAIRAIKADAVDYMLKPPIVEEFVLAINKCIGLITSENTALQSTINLGEKLRKEEGTIVVLRTSGEIHLSKIGDIVRCESDKGYTTIFLNSAKKIVVTKTIKEVEKIIHSPSFIRVHQSHLVNIRFISEIFKSGPLYLILKDGSKIPLASRRKEEVIQFLAEFPNL